MFASVNLPAGGCGGAMQSISGNREHGSKISAISLHDATISGRENSYKSNN